MSKLISIYNRLMKDLKEKEYPNTLMFEEALKVVWDRTLELLIIDGTFAKAKRDAKLPYGMLYRAMSYGLKVFYEPEMDIYKKHYKDMVSLISFYLLDGCNTQNGGDDK